MKLRITNGFTFTGLAVLLILTSCAKSCSRSGEGTAVNGNSPDEVVKRFVELSASAKDGADKRKLEELCAGEMRRAFERMTEEVFRISYLTNSLKVNELKILESKADTDTARVHYQVAVENAQGTDATKEINEREVELTRSQGTWYIDSIKLKGTDKVAFMNGMMF